MYTILCTLHAVQKNVKCTNHTIHRLLFSVQYTHHSKNSQLFSGPNSEQFMKDTVHSQLFTVHMSPAWRKLTCPGPSSVRSRQPGLQVVASIVL